MSTADSRQIRSGKQVITKKYKVKVKEKKETTTPTTNDDDDDSNSCKKQTTSVVVGDACGVGGGDGAEDDDVNNDSNQVQRSFSRGKDDFCNQCFWSLLCAG